MRNRISVLGETVLEGTPVLDKTFVPESLSVVLEGIPEVLEGAFVLLEDISVIVLDGRLVVPEGTALEVDESASLVLVNVAERQSVDADKKHGTTHEMKPKWMMVTPSIPSS